MSTRRRTAPLIVVLGITAGLSGSSQASDSSTTFQRIFDEYLHGDADVAVRELAAWPEARVEAEAGPLPDSADPWTRAARALLHTEAALLNETFAGQRLGITRLQHAPLEYHARTGLGLVDELARSGDPDLVAFARQWMIFASSLNHRVFRAGYEDAFSGLARGHFLRDPEVELLSGSVAEDFTGPISGQAHMTKAFRGDEGSHFSTVHGIFSRRFQGEALLSLRRAVEAETRDGRSPGSVGAEGRLRLGRIGYLSGTPRPSEARKLLETALKDGQAANRRFVSYLAALFLGEMHERDRRTAEAAKLYRTAIELEPRAHPAYVALSQLRLGEGRHDEAWRVINELFAAAGPAGDIWSPWALYPFAQFHESYERLQAMRELVAARSGRPRVSTLPFPYLAPPPQQTAAALPDASALSSPAVRGVDAPVGQGAAFRAGVEGVRVDVTVMNGDEPLRGLTADDFFVLDNGRGQRIESVATIPHLAIALVIDISHDTSVPLREHLLPAARAILDGLRPDDRVTVLTVEDSFRLLTRAESDLRVVRRTLDSVEAVRRRYTALWDGAYAAAAVVAQDPGRPVVALFSDHVDPLGAGSENVSWLGFEPAKDRLRASGVVTDGIWTRIEYQSPEIGYEDQTDITWGRRLGDDLVKATGGQAFRLEDPRALDQIRERLNRLRSGYVITYTPTGVKTGDGWHRLEVRLRGKRGEVTARPGYYSGRPGRR